MIQMNCASKLSPMRFGRIQAQKDHLVFTVVKKLVRQTIFDQLPTKTDIQSNHPVEIRVDVAVLRTTEEEGFDVLA